jgi:hypothetical protein
METAALLLRCCIMKFTSNLKCLENVLSYSLDYLAVITSVVHIYCGSGVSVICNNGLY